MGKKNFKDLYRRVKGEHGNVTCEISVFSDNFNPLLRYAGVIIYSIDGKFEWENYAGGKAYGRRGRSFYIIIQCTDNWSDDYYKPVGQGTVHDYLLKNVMGIESDQKRIACGGFAYLFHELKFSSIWLNGTDQTDAESDGDRYLSDSEKILVAYCWEEYKKHGAHHVFSVPFFIDELLLN
ncbi:unnamed protein product [Rotaria socialis]|uniref:Uncharacterized protein n=1 Tax=Rotaria socialis TaxID=392032 RepID=A0A818YXC9_9BILA|nr:unnamed protein product [Rotaria socialis]CAF3394169.1 unnamed protein product [Rotaria socialis]CAF3431524.1 unnamed protein product [Rotaria socialis]CAF3631569.1 unnamed protein product [Rotaria socialis]CAF3756082.1 unnamed protein product [Rotaria socialis]